ncbi:DUF952 domain-containing protein [Arthrobacter sp. NEB 688]|uniref:DUF952 domain-containing protein n=1 Tax=Arthrobacter sp. NEB 688 TaxID=904039 RepID=UPI001566F40E|nr:DUF952 domain-containing protein [Arthrobacter sp. NEB 688]QKE83390.1 DUF952 domain-containing protein [Arthrobacter sp. NEB 688]
MTDDLFHIAHAEQWEKARALGRYEQSTHGLSLDEVGFIHLSTSEQWPGVLQRFYADVDDELVLLTIDPERLSSPVRWEAPEGVDEEFPHLYGPLDAGAVTATRPL